MLKIFYHSPRGFTLIELMIVIVIIGILAAMAIVMFSSSTVKTSQAEAQVILKQVFTEQQTYRSQHNTYWGPCGTVASASAPNAFSPIGVDIMPSANYTYTICSPDPFHFTIIAISSNLDDDLAVDSWQIDETGNLQCTSDDAVL